MKFQTLFASVAATVIALVPTTSFAADVTGSNSEDLLTTGCLIPLELTSGAVDSQIQINLADTLTNLTLVEGNDYQFDFSAQVSDPNIIDPSCIDQGMVTVTYDVEYSIDNTTNFAIVNPDLLGQVLTGAEVGTPVPFSFTLNVIDDSIDSIETFVNMVTVDITATVSYTDNAAVTNVE